jgi:hypothetical protein
MSCTPRPRAWTDLSCARRKTVRRTPVATHRIMQVSKSSEQTTALTFGLRRKMGRRSYDPMSCGRLQSKGRTWHLLPRDRDAAHPMVRMLQAQGSCCTDSACLRVLATFLHRVSQYFSTCQAHPQPRVRVSIRALPP